MDFVVELNIDEEKDSFPTPKNDIHVFLRGSVGTGAGAHCTGPQ